MSQKTFGRFAAVLLLAAGAAVAQSTMGTITGLVSDSSQAVIPGATVVAKNMATGAETRTTTSSTGNYVLLNLPVGSYELSVTQTGFKSYVRANIPLSGNETARIDVALAVGQVSERVEVTGETPALKTESTEVSTIMENKLVNECRWPSQASAAACATPSAS